MKVINFDMIMYHGKPTKYYLHFEKKILSMIKGLGISPSPRGNCAYGCRLFWAVDMSTPLLLEVRGRGRGVAPPPDPRYRLALAMSVHPTYFDLVTPLIVGRGVREQIFCTNSLPFQ